MTGPPFVICPFAMMGPIWLSKLGCELLVERQNRSQASMLTISLPPSRECLLLADNPGYVEASLGSLDTVKPS